MVLFTQKSEYEAIQKKKNNMKIHNTLSRYEKALAAKIFIFFIIAHDF